MNNKPLVVRMNEEDRLIHEWLKNFFGLKNLFGEEAQTIKMSETVAFNVLRNTFGDELRDIFKRKTRDELLEIRAIQKERIKKSNTLNKKNRG